VATERVKKKRSFCVCIVKIEFIFILTFLQDPWKRSQC